MRRRIWVLSAAVVLTGVVAVGGGVVAAGADRETPAPQDTPANTATVVRGSLSATVSQAGILTYRARSDGSPYSVINRLSGVYTRLPDVGTEVHCGGVLYRVDDEPVLLLCGTMPAYRDLSRGDEGPDVRQLNRDLHRLGYDGGAHLDPGENEFTYRTEKALGALQRDKGFRVTGTLPLGGAVFLPDSARVAKVSGDLGGSARPGALVLSATSDDLRVQVTLDPSEQGQVRKGDRARITLPGNTSASGRVEAFGRVAQAPDGPDGKAAADATVPTYISLDDPSAASGLDQAPVQVDITTKGVDDALSVPVTALLGRAGGGFAVEAVRDGGRRELVAVRLGLFDTGGGRVQVEGGLRQGDHVVVPSS